MPDTSTRNSLALPLSTDGGNTFYTGLHASLETIDAAIAKCNWAAADDPGVGDDSADGYVPGSLWFNTTGHKIFQCEDNTAGAAVWRQIWPAKTADLSGTISNDKLAGSISNDKLLSADGWIAAPALTYDAADAPVYTVTCTGDYSAIIMPGMRIKLTQGGSVKYFIVVKSTYSSPSTTLTLYGGTDYTLGATITYPYYSMLKCPAGFPMSPAKWTVSLVDANDNHQSNPVKDTYYTPGNLTITLPIGVWDVSFQVVAVCATSSGTFTEVFVGLSTANNSFSDQELRGRGYLGGVTAGIFIGQVARRKILTIASKTVYYVVCRTTIDNHSVIGFNGSSDASTMVLAVCGYL